MEFSHSPAKIQNETGRWFLVVSLIDGGCLARDAVTSDLVYIKHSDIANGDDVQSAQ